MKKILIIILAIIFIFWLLHQFGAAAGRPVSSQPCTTKPCIKIELDKKRTYELNDFRFLPNHCIKFISLPDSIDRHYCGNYKLTWIGLQPRQDIDMSQNVDSVHKAVDSVEKQLYESN